MANNNNFVKTNELLFENDEEWAQIEGHIDPNDIGEVNIGVGEGPKPNVEAPHDEGLLVNVEAGLVEPEEANLVEADLEGILNVADNVAGLVAPEANINVADQAALEGDIDINAEAGVQVVGPEANIIVADQAYLEGDVNVEEVIQVNVDAVEDEITELTRKKVSSHDRKRGYFVVPIGGLELMEIHAAYDFPFTVYERDGDASHQLTMKRTGKYARITGLKSYYQTHNVQEGDTVVFQLEEGIIYIALV